MLKRRLLNVLKVAFGLGMLALVARGLNFAEVRELVRRGDPKLLVLGVVSLLVALMYFQWTRLHVLIKGLTRSVAASLEIFYVGALFNNLLPSNIGGDAIRLVYLRKLQVDNWGTPFMLLLIHRLSGFVVLVFSGLVYLAIEHTRILQLAESHHLPVHAGEGKGTLVFAVLAVGCVVLALAVRKLSSGMRERVLGFLRNCRAAFAIVSRADLAWLMVHTLLFHFSRMLAFYFLVAYLGQHVGLWDLVFVISATGVAAVLPVTVAGLGIVEGSITVLLSLYGVQSSAAVAVALVNRLVLLLMAAIGGVVYATSGGRTDVETANAVPQR